MLNSNLNTNIISPVNRLQNETPAEFKGGDRPYGHEIFNKRIDSIIEIYQTKHRSTPAPSHPAPGNDYLTACVNKSSQLPPCLPPRNNEVRPSPDSHQRNIFNFMLNRWFQAHHDGVGENIKIKLIQCMRYFLHEYEKTHYSGTPVLNPATSEQPFSLPDELKCILPSGFLVEKILLEMMILLLSEEKANFSCTPTLVYGHDESRTHHNPQEFLKQDMAQRFSIVRAKLKNLSIGHYLMVPLLSLDTGEDGLISPEGHFSAILVEKTLVGFTFNIIDSYDSGTENENKEKLIYSLIDISSNNEIRYFGSKFQFNNDCGIHMYNFFRLCIRTPSVTLAESGNLRQMIDQYIRNIQALEQLLGRDSNATSRLLRIFFVLDGIKSGYSQGMAYDILKLDKIYKVEESSAVARILTRSASFWQQIRRSSSLTFGSWKRRSKSDSSMT